MTATWAAFVLNSGAIKWSRHYIKTASRARLRLQLRRGKMLVVHYIKHGGVLSPMILKIGAAIAY